MLFFVKNHCKINYIDILQELHLTKWVTLDVVRELLTKLKWVTGTTMAKFHESRAKIKNVIACAGYMTTPHVKTSLHST